MKRDENPEVVRGSGNVFRDLGWNNADAEQVKAILANEIIKALDRERLTVRAAHARTGIAAADFSRIRNADLGRFMAESLITVLNRLGSRVEVNVRIRPVKALHECRPAGGLLGLIAASLVLPMYAFSDGSLLTC